MMWCQKAYHEFHETCHFVTFIVLVNSHQKWKQMRNRVCFHLWCELTSTMNVTKWQVSCNSCIGSTIHIFVVTENCISSILLYAYILYFFFYLFHTLLLLFTLYNSIGYLFLTFTYLFLPDSSWNAWNAWFIYSWNCSEFLKC